MNLIGEFADAFLDLANNQRVDVFICSTFIKTDFAGLFTESFEGVDKLSTLGRGQDTDPCKRPRKSLRAANVGVEQAAVEMQRAGEALEDFRGPFGETAAPEFHTDFFWTCFKDART